MKGKSVLVTGVGGFIGSNLVEKISNEYDHIIGIDNLNNYYDVELKKTNLSILRKIKNFSFFKIDIRDYSELEKLFKNYKIKKIIHLAAQAGVRYSLENPFFYEETNIKGTLNLLELSRKYNIKHFIFASSSSVYGNQKKTPFNEEDPINKPISVYAATKQAGESLCYTYNHLYDIDINCLRFFTVYGPRGRPDMAPHKFVEKILLEKPIHIYDDGKTNLARDFTYISDITEGISLASNFQKGFQIFNLGYGEPINVMDFIKTIEKLTEKQSKINFIGRQPGDVNITYSDITKAKKLLGFHPKISVEVGLARFIKWFLNYY